MKSAFVRLSLKYSNGNFVIAAIAYLFLLATAVLNCAQNGAKDSSLIPAPLIGVIATSNVRAVAMSSFIAFFAIFLITAD